MRHPNLHPLTLIAPWLLSAPGSSSARTWYIQPDASGDAPTIQAGVDSSAAGDTVLVAAGSYTWASQGGSDLGFTGPTMVMMIATEITLLGESGAAATVLDAEGQGRVIYCVNALNVVIDGLWIRGGSAIDTQPVSVTLGSGGGILAGGTGIIVRNCVISDNHADYLGGGIELDHPSAAPPLVVDNVFYANEAYARGSAIEAHAQTKTILRNNTILNGLGGAIGIVSDSCTVENNIVAGTMATTGNDGYALFCSFGYPLVRCNDFWDNAGDDAICGIDGGGNFSADPEFCAPDPVASGDFGIRSDSPCAPENSAGCGLVGAVPVACGPGPTAIRDEGAGGGGQLLRNRPNPFHPMTTIEYRVEAPGPVRVRIYDVGGRLVRTLVNGRSGPPAAHTVTWDGTTDSGGTAPGGVYVCRMEAGPVVETCRIVRLR